MVTRKNIRALTPTEKTDFVNAVLAMKASGAYAHYVDRHANTPMQDIHSCSAFLPWHRQLLVDFEKDLQLASGDNTMALPYWNWAQDMEDVANGVLADLKDGPLWNTDLLGGNGDPGDGDKVKTGSFAEGSWETIDSSLNPKGALRRNLGGNATVPDLPTQAQINAALSITDYDSSPWNRRASPSFRNQLEGWRPSSNAPGLHNRGHVWIGGDMEDVPTAPNDPAFFLHHCFVDKIWADWQVRHGLTNYRGRPGQQPGDNMQATPSGVHTIESTFDISALDYTYDTLASAPSPPSGGSDEICFLAAIAAGTALEPSLNIIRNLRDVLCYSPVWGASARSITRLYYRISPQLVEQMNRSKSFHLVVKYGAVRPFLTVIDKISRKQQA